MALHELIASPGCGSVVVELAFALSGVPLHVTEIPYLTPGPHRDRLLSLNPLGQVPVLILPGGTVMTESAAMILHLADLAPAAALLPDPAHPNRAHALNQLVVFVAAIYPAVTFSDPPENWTIPGPAADQLGERLASRKADLWRRLEHTANPTPFLYGERPTAPDLYVAVMLHWRPGPAWFAANTPKLATIARHVARHPALAPIMAHHFPP